MENIYISPNIRRRTEREITHIYTYMHTHIHTYIHIRRSKPKKQEI